MPTKLLHFFRLFYLKLWFKTLIRRKNSLHYCFHIHDFFSVAKKFCFILKMWLSIIRYQSIKNTILIPVCEILFSFLILLWIFSLDITEMNKSFPLLLLPWLTDNLMSCSNGSFLKVGKVSRLFVNMHFYLLR